MSLYAFDVDDTLEISRGPVKLADIVALKAAGHIVGVCGNWGLLCQLVPEWHRLFSFIGPMTMTKEVFLGQLAAFVPASEYVMVGNSHLIAGAFDDFAAANKAGWRFLTETEFAQGHR